MSDDEKAGPGWTKFGVTTVIAVLALIAGFLQFGTTSSYSVRQPFLEMQSELCRSAAEHAARLASTRDPETWKKSREEFWMLYWGPLAIVEDVEAKTHNVEEKMVQFGEELIKTNPSSPTLPISSLEQPALKIAYACRDLLSSKWNAGILGWFRYR